MSKTYKTIVIDDERLARQKLKKLLEAFPQIEVTGEAHDVQSAVTLINENAPDLVFLDVQMPGGSGLDMLNMVVPNFHTIFVTAHDQYAIRAFEVNALDYLLKPITPERLKKALDRLGRFKTEPPELQLDYHDRLFVPAQSKSAFLDIAKIVCIEADVYYSCLHTIDGERILLKRSLAQWETCLPEHHFIRVHRSAIVNLDYVSNVKPLHNYSYEVYLQGKDDPVQMSRRYGRDLKDKLNQMPGGKATI